MTVSRLLVSCLVGLAMTSAASAHATFENPESRPGSSYKAVLKIPHGCSGSATLKVRVQIPEGFFGVKPQPKAGWSLETIRHAYAKPYQSYHRQLTEGVVEIIWSGRLPDDFYDDFVFTGQFAKDLPTGQPFFFPVVQECETGADRWIELPKPGQDPHTLEFPAPGVRLLAP